MNPNLRQENVQPSLHYAHFKQTNIDTYPKQPTIMEKNSSNNIPSTVKFNMMKHESLDKITLTLTSLAKEKPCHMSVFRSLLVMLVFIISFANNDVSAQLPEQMGDAFSSELCSCNEYIYLNQPNSSGGNGALHKYLVNSDGTLTEIDDPIYDNLAPTAVPGQTATAPGPLPNPHGLAVDQNGNIFVGDTQVNARIFRLTCTGDLITPNSPDFTNTGVFNLASGPGVIYSNQTNANGSVRDITRYNPCTGDVEASVDFCEPTNRDWGYHRDPRTGIHYATNGFGPDAHQLWIFTDADFDTANANACISAVNSDAAGAPPMDPNNPLTLLGPGDLRGVTTDADGNIYIAYRSVPATDAMGNPIIDPMTGGQALGSVIVKYDPSGTVELDRTPFDLDGNDGGWFFATGIVYSEITNRIYTSSESPTESCAWSFDANNLMTPGFEVVEPVGVNEAGAKGMAIGVECCPVAPEQIINLCFCAEDLLDTVLFINDLYDCPGIICEAPWEMMDVPGATYNDCQQAITLDPEILSLEGACISVVKELTLDDLENNPNRDNFQCGVFRIEINLEIVAKDTTDIVGNQFVCEGEAPEKIVGTTVDNGMPDDSTSFQWQIAPTEFGAFVDIPDSTNNCITPEARAGSNPLYYRLITKTTGSCLAEDNCMCFDTSNVVTITPVPAQKIDIDIKGDPELTCCDSLSFDIELWPDTLMGTWTTTGAGTLDLTASTGTDGDHVTYIPAAADDGEFEMIFTVPMTNPQCGPTADTVKFWVIADDEAPEFANCPPDISVDLGTCSDMLSLEWPIPVATDNCELASVAFNSTTAVAPMTASEATFGQDVVAGDYTIAYTATDAKGNTSECVFVMTVNPATDMPPSVICQADFTVPADDGVCTFTAPDGSLNAIVNDPCGVIAAADFTHTITPAGGTATTGTGNVPSGTVLALGATEICYILSETDASVDPPIVTQVDMCCFTVTVEDTEAPMLTCPADATVTAAIAMCQSPPLAISPTITDNCDMAATLIPVISVTNPDGTITTPAVSPFAFLQGESTIDITVEDAAGNESSCSYTVSVACSSIGLAKREVSVELMDDGCTEVVYELNIENFGNTDIDMVQVVDNLAMAGYSACSMFTATATSDDFSINPMYNGNGMNNLLLGSDDIVAGDKGAILLTVEACGCPTPTNIMNSATVTGAGPDGPVSDVSSSGSDPDPNGDGDPSNDDSTTDSVLGSIPSIGLAKREAKTWLQDDGCALVEYEFNIVNSGNVNLADVTLVDNDLLTNFATACQSVEIKEITSDDFIANGDYADALATGNLIVPTGNNLQVGDKGAVLLTVEACGCGNTTISNTATAGGSPPDGSGPITDDSDSGSDPDGDGDGDPSNDDDPTLTPLTSDPGIGLAKRAAKTWLMDDGCALVEYEFNIVNSGNVNLADVTLVDNDLLTNFATACQSVEIKEITSDDFIANGDYADALATGNLIVPTGNNLQVGDKGAVLLTVEACGCGNTTISNTATAGGSPPDGSGPITDDSDSGSDPDGDGDGDPSNDDDPTLTPLTSDPGIGLAKRAAKTWLMDDGCALVEYEFNIVNSGNVNLADVTLVDNDLLTNFATACQSVEIKEITSDDFIANGDYADALATGNLIVPTGNNLQVGDKGAVLLTVEACGCGNTTISNTATAGGSPPDGSGPITDDSDSGSDPDGDGDGDPSNDDDPTLTPLTSDPGIGLAKRAAKTWLMDDGCALVEYEFNIVNSGNVNLADVTLVDNDLLTNFATACQSVEIKEITSDDFIANGDYADALATGNLIVPTGNNLQVGDKGAVLLTVEACGCGNTTISNTATAGGSPPDGSGPITDDSDSGSDPDGDGDGDPSNDDDPTLTPLTSDPGIGLAKRAAKTWLMDDGCALVEYEFNIVNSGNVNLADVTLVDNDLLTNFATACQSVEIKEITSDDFIANGDYADALATGNLIVPTGNNLQVGDKGAVLLTVEACGCGNTTISNTATAGGSPPDGSGPITDDSDSGSDPDGDGDGDPSNDDDPTLTPLTSDPGIGLAKRAAKTWLMDDGCALVEYEFNIVNSGNVNLADVTLVDNDLLTNFATACQSVEIKEITSDDFIANGDYADALATGNLIVPTGNNLQVGDKGAVLLTVEACGCGNTTISNTATAGGSPPDGSGPITDDSDSGSDPDGDGDGDPSNDDDPTLTPLTSDPGIGLAKRAAKTWLMDDGCALVEYEFNIVNSGNVNLSDVTLVDNDLLTNFATACQSVEIKEITSDDFIANGDYADALATGNLIVPTGNNLQVGDKGAVLLTVEACGCGNTTISNTATAGGSPPDGSGPITDDSDSGSDPDGDGDGDPSNDDDPTLTPLTSDPGIGLAKRAAKTWLMDDGCALVEYEFNIVNSGNVNLADVTLVDNDLLTNFATACQSVEIKEITSDDFIANGDYADALATGNLIVPTGNNLQVGDKGAVLLTVEACGCGNTTISNTATAGGSPPDGSGPITDDSVSGSDPDADGDGDPGNDSGPTMNPLTEDPAIGTSKRAVQVINNADGSSTVTFEFNIQNYGNVNLSNVQLMDDLASAFAPCSVDVLSITSDDFIVNAGYDGVADINLLAGIDALPVGDKGGILLTINVNNCGGNTGTFMNQATASGDTPSGGSVTDDSTNGANPDPNGDGDPGEDIPTPIDFEFMPAIGIAKNAVSIVNNADGSSVVIYEFNIENFGNQVMSDIQVTDNLGVVFAPCTVEVLELTSDDFTANNFGPNEYDGVTVFNLLTGTDTLGVGDKGAILLTIRTSDCQGVTGTFNNQATVTATAPDGSGLSDLSTNGPDADPNNDGNPNEGSATPVDFGFNPALGASKRVSEGPILNDDGCFDLTYEIKVQNFGDVDLSNIQVLEDLAATFAGAQSFEVISIESEEFDVNVDFDGVGDMLLLTGNDTLISTPGGNEGAIYLTLNVCPGANPAGPFNNSVTASANAPDGSSLSDQSTDGSEADGDGDGDPSNDDTETPVSFEFDPSFGLAKRLASIQMISDECALVTYEFNIENFGNVDIDSIQVIDDLMTAFAGCAGSVSIFEITSDDFTVNGDYADAFATGNLLNGTDDLPVGDLGSILLTVEACTCGTSSIVNSATISGVDPVGDPLEDDSVNGSDPDPDGDGDPSEAEPTEHTIVCTVEIVCPDVHDPVNVQNDQEECGAIVNFPDAEILSNCIGIDNMDVQFMLTPVDGTLPVTDPANGDAVVPYATWITGQAGGLNYPVDTITVTYRINPADLPTDPPAPIVLPLPDGMCSLDVIVRDEQCPVFVTTMPEDTLVLGNMCDIPPVFNLNPLWHLRDNCDEPEEIQIDFEEEVFDSICPNTFTLKRTWFITDQAGNTCEHNHKIFFRDEAPPVLTLPPDVTIDECELETVITNCRLVFTPIDTVEESILIGDVWVVTQLVLKDTTEVCDTLFATVPLSAGTATASDGTCTAAEDIIITFRDSVDLLCKGDKAAVVNRIWIAEDECGNRDSLIQEITIIDPNPPVLEVPDEVTISIDENGHVSLTRELIGAEVFDACFTDIDDVILDFQPAFFNCSDIGSHRIVVAATDPCNNRTAYEELVVIIEDSQAPVLNCPSGTVDIAINPSNCDASFSQILDILEGPDCDVSITTSPELGVGIDMSTTSITVTATDASGNSSVCVVPVNITLTEEIDFSEVLACNDRINVSLNGGCYLEITPDMILDGDLAICSDLLCVEVTDESGSDHLNFFDLSDIGQTFNVRVQDCSGLGNSCWGQVRIEEKQIPIVAFPVDTTLLCVEPTGPDYFKLGFPELLNCESDVEMDFEDIYSEFGECNDPRAIIERRWVVRDDEGNVVRDTQFINIIPFSTDHVRFPDNITLEDPVDCARITESFFDIENGLIAPTSVLHPDSTGIPDIFGLPLQNGSGLCLFSMGYTDEILEICGGSFQVLRRWTLNDVCGVNTEPLIHTQFITVFDIDGPEVLDERLPITESVDPWQCEFTGILPLPESISQACGDISFEAYITGEEAGYLLVEGALETNDLSVVAVNVGLGSHWVTYVYKDGCSNIELFKYQLNVIDEIDPTALCSAETTLSLTSGTNGAGTGILFASDLDAGSRDSGCGPIESLCVIRQVDFDAGILATIDGRNAYLAMSTCDIDGELLDTIVDKNNVIEAVVAVPYVFCKDFVKFCCDDTSEAQDVVVLVEDAQGLDNFCVTSVSVIDNSAVSLNCLPHSITCTDDADISILPPTEDMTNCGSDLTLAFFDENDFVNSCGAGQIFRVWFVDLNNNGMLDDDETSCNQVISVNSDVAFDPFTIKWPKHYTGEVIEGVNIECNADGEAVTESSLVLVGAVMECTSAVSTEPVWCSSECGLIGLSMESDTLVAGDACLKIVKRWTLIDWCTWEGNGDDIDDENDTDTDSFEVVEDWAQGECTGCPDGISEDPVYFRYVEFDPDGFYTFDQVIEVLDTTAPTIATSDVDVNVTGGSTAKGDDTICESDGMLSASASDFCGDLAFDGSSLRWIVSYNDGTSTTESFFTGSEINVPTLNGTAGSSHSVTLTVSDGCGNSTTESVSVNFADGKAPTPLCIAGVTTAFLESTGEVSVWANDFDLGSFDNCSDILFSIVRRGEQPIPPSGDGFEDQANIAFTCEDLTAFVELDVWVWDNSDNGDFCQVSVLIGGECNPEAGQSAIIAGNIATMFGDMVDDAIVSMNGTAGAEYPKSTVTDNTGDYAFNSNPYTFDYDLSVDKFDDYSNGVSTLDLVLIQKHILGLTSFVSPYSFLAGDINNNGSISAADLIELRQLILGNVLELSNTSSWRFVDASQEFFDDSNPFPFIESISINDLSANMSNENFIGVKIGDLSGDAVANRLMTNEIRTSGLVTLTAEDNTFDAGQVISLPVSAENFSAISGYQFTLDHKGLELLGVTKGVLDVTEANLGVRNEQLTMSWAEARAITTSDVLFTLVFKATDGGQLSTSLNLNSSITKAEAYVGISLDRADIELAINSSHNSLFDLYQNSPNPFGEATKIGFNLPDAGTAKLTVYDVSGKTVMSMNGNYSKGYNEIILMKEQLGVGGVLYYELENGNNIARKKMIVLD